MDEVAANAPDSPLLAAKTSTAKDKELLEDEEVNFLNLSSRSCQIICFSYWLSAFSKHRKLFSVCQSTSARAKCAVGIALQAIPPL